jgi:hypothetical protein
MMSQACGLDLRNEKFMQNFGLESLGNRHLEDQEEGNIDMSLKGTGCEDGRWI